MIACQAESFPSPTEISWKFRGKLIKPESADFTILESLDGTLVKSMIMIKSIRIEQFGEYECIFQNNIGKDSSKIHIIETGTALIKSYLILIFLLCRFFANSGCHFCRN